MSSGMVYNSNYFLYFKYNFNFNFILFCTYIKNYSINIKKKKKEQLNAAMVHVYVCARRLIEP